MYTNNPINDVLMNMPQVSISEGNINISDNSFKDNLFHEYTHYVIDRFIEDNNMDKNSLPLWFQEGICEYITTNNIFESVFKYIRRVAKGTDSDAQWRRDVRTFCDRVDTKGKCLF